MDGSEWCFWLIKVDFYNKYVEFRSNHDEWRRSLLVDKKQSNHSNSSLDFIISSKSTFDKPYPRYTVDIQLEDLLMYRSLWARYICPWGFLIKNPICTRIYWFNVRKARCTTGYRSRYITILMNQKNILAWTVVPFQLLFVASKNSATIIDEVFSVFFKVHISYDFLEQLIQLVWLLSVYHKIHQ